MIVVSDTSPLTALLTVGQTDILARLFGDVIIPSAVNNELLCHHSHLPVWIRVVAVQNTARAAAFSHIVDRGEAEAIELARELKADRLLIDERKGRRLAAQEKIPVIGLLGVVLLAKRRSLILSARELLARLETEAGMYLDDNIREEALKSVGE